MSGPILFLRQCSVCLSIAVLALCVGAQAGHCCYYLGTGIPCYVSACYCSASISSVYTISGHKFVDCVETGSFGSAHDGQHSDMCAFADGGVNPNNKAGLCDMTSTSCGTFVVSWTREVHSGDTVHFNGKGM